jgi:hypothetical protein
MRKFALSAILAVASLSIPSVSSAALLNGGAGLIPALPDVFSSFVTVTYNASTGALNVTGTPLTITQLLPLPTITIGGPRSFSINAVVTTAGVLTSGTITLTGNIDGVAGAETVISSSSPLAFGFGSSKLEFIFLNNAGVLNTGQGIGVIISNPAIGGLPSTFDWRQSFTTNNQGVTDAFIPEPSSLGLIVPALAMLGRRRRA